MSLATILFIIVMLHLVVGFGWAIYKMEFAPRKKNNKADEN